MEGITKAKADRKKRTEKEEKKKAQNKRMYGTLIPNIESHDHKRRSISMYGVKKVSGNLHDDA